MLLVLELVVVVDVLHVSRKLVDVSFFFFKMMFQMVSPLDNDGGYEGAVLVMVDTGVAG